MDTSSVQYILRPKDVQKVASLLNMPQETILHFNELRLLNTSYIRSLLMRADFERLTYGVHRLGEEDRVYLYPEVVKAIAQEYGISAKECSKILHGRDEEIFFCSKCGIRIPRKNMKSKQGMCSNCYVDTLRMSI